MGELLPTNVRVRDDSPLAQSAAGPSCHDVPTGMPPLVTEGVGGVDMNLPPSTMTPRDPSAMSPSIRPTPSTIAWAANGMGRADALGDVVVAPDYDPCVTATASSTYVDGVMTGCTTSIAVDATSAVGSPIRPVVGSSITNITGYSVTSKGAP